MVRKDFVINVRFCKGVLRVLINVGQLKFTGVAVTTSADPSLVSVLQ